MQMEDSELNRKSCLGTRAFLVGAILVALTACASGSNPDPTPTPDIPATVDAAIQATVAAWPAATPRPTYTPYPIPTPVPTSDIPATVAAAVQAAVAALPTTTPRPTYTPFPTQTAIPTPPLMATPTPRLLGKPEGTYRQYAQPPVMTIDSAADYSAVIRTNQGSITVQLFASEAPKTVNSFVFLAREGFYDGLIFHRVIPRFMIQGGDPTGSGSSGPGYKFEDEIVANLRFDGPGVLAMANAGPNTNGSQFFITVAQTPHLTGGHTIFGRVVDGQNVANAISAVPTDRGNRPVQPVIIEAVEITGP